jgi:hypothetical protein
MLNNYVNFVISIMKKLADLAHEKYNRWLIGGHGILDQYSWMLAAPYRNSHLCTENSSSTIAFVRHCA